MSCCSAFVYDWGEGGLPPLYAGFFVATEALGAKVEAVFFTNEETCICGTRVAAALRSQPQHRLEEAAVGSAYALCGSQGVKYRTFFSASLLLASPRTGALCFGRLLLFAAASEPGEGAPLCVLSQELGDLVNMQLLSTFQLYLR